MNSINKWTLAAATVGVVLLGAVAGIAQDKAKIIDDRVAMMKAQGADTKAISDYAKGTGDQAKAVAAADDLLAIDARIVGMFPAGTSSADFPGKSLAKPTIWTDHAGFVKSVADLHDLEVALSTAVKTGTPADVTAALAPLGRQGCGGCHNAYREKPPTPAA